MVKEDPTQMGYGVKEKKTLALCNFLSGSL